MHTLIHAYADTYVLCIHCLLECFYATREYFSFSDRIHPHFVGIVVRYYCCQLFNGYAMFCMYFPFHCFLFFLSLSFLLLLLLSLVIIILEPLPLLIKRCFKSFSFFFLFLFIFSRACRHLFTHLLEILECTSMSNSIHTQTHMFACFSLDAITFFSIFFFFVYLNLFQIQCHSL